MKTATATWITYNNYGTILQAYALQKQVELLDHENVILSDDEILKAFRAEHNQQKKTSHVIGITSKNKGFLSRLMQLVVNPGRLSRVILAHTNQEKYRRPYVDSQNRCDIFKEQNLKILYGETKDTLTALNDQFDVFIAGSDQVWSAFDNIFNPYYYLDFVNKRKVSYAPSLGTDNISEQTGRKIKELLSDFFAISVREQVSAGQLSKITGRDVAWVVDPTLLHSKEFWSQFAKDVPVIKKRYLLCYFLENKTWYFQYAKKLARKLRLKIVLIPNRWEYISSEYVTKDGIGPQEFVSLFRHADYVLTDSYHGSIFSIIFEKSFQYLLRFAKDDRFSQNIRIESLFDYLELHDRVVCEEALGVNELFMEYGEINKKLTQFRKRSKEFLADCLN